MRNVTRGCVKANFTERDPPPEMGGGQTLPIAGQARAVARVLIHRVVAGVHPDSELASETTRRGADLVDDINVITAASADCMPAKRP